MSDKACVNSPPAHPPLFPEIGILAMVPDEWDASCQVRHYVNSRLSRFFHVIWYTPTREWREWLFGSPWHGSRKSRTRRISSGLEVYSASPYLPRLYSPKTAALFLERMRTRQVTSLLNKSGVRKTILYIWRPQFKWALDQFSFDLLCYHIDDEYGFSPVELPIHPDEQELLERADQVIVHSPALMERKGHVNSDTALIPNGVAFAAYRQPRREPTVLAPIPRPRIGYAGWIKSQLDIDILLELAERHAQWSFVYAGPVRVSDQDKPTVDRLFALSNVYYLGPQEPDDLPALVQHFDVCTMCYRENDYTHCIYPLKVHEYLATGKPVVGTPINTLLDFVDTITLATTPVEWSAAIAESLTAAENSDARRAQRIAVAREHDWDKLVERIARLLAARLGDSFLAEFDRVVGAEPC